jgi:hypothetical protein
MLKRCLTSKYSPLASQKKNLNGACSHIKIEKHLPVSLLSLEFEKSILALSFNPHPR